MNEKFRDELISAYLDGELTAEEQTLVEEQLMDSVEHRKMFEELRALRASLQSMPLHKLDDKFHERVLKRAERAMLSSRDGDSNQDAGEDSTTGRSVHAGKAAPHDKPSSGDTLVEPARRADTRRQSRQLLWTSLAVMAGMLLIGALIVFPRGAEQLADNQSPPQASDAANARQSEAEGLSQLNVDNPPVSERFEEVDALSVNADKHRLAAELQQAGGASDALRTDGAAPAAGKPSRSMVLSADDGAGYADEAPTASRREMLRKSAAGASAASRLAGDAAETEQKLFELDARNKGLEQRALSALEQSVAAAPVETRIVKVVMSEDAYRSGVFDEELTRNQIAIDRSTDLALQRFARGAPELAKDNSSSDDFADNYLKREQSGRQAATYEVVMVDADAMQIDRVVAGLNGLPGQKVSTSVYRQPLAKYHAENQQLGDYAGTAPLQEAAGESNGVGDGFRLTPPGVNRGVAGESELFRGGGGFGGGGFGAAKPSADRATQAEATPAPLADAAAPSGAASKSKVEPTTAPADAPAKPRASLPAPVGDPAAAGRQADKKADGEPARDLPNSTAAPSAPLDAKRNPAPAEEKSDARLRGTRAGTGAGGPGSASPAPGGTEPPAVPPAAKESEVPRPVAPAAPAFSGRNALPSEEPVPADPDPQPARVQDRLMSVGTARRLNEKEVKELTEELARFEQVDQARHAALQSVLEKAASVVGDLEPAVTETAPQAELESKASKSKKQGSEGALPADAASEPRTAGGLAPPRAAEQRGRTATETKPLSRGLDRETTASTDAESDGDKRRRGNRPGNDAQPEDLAAAEGDEAESVPSLRDRMSEQAEAMNFRYAAPGGEIAPGRMRVLFVIEVVPNRLPAEQPAASTTETPAEKAPAAPAPK